jgi:hypothetical protein
MFDDSVNSIGMSALLGGVSGATGLGMAGTAQYAHGPWLGGGFKNRFVQAGIGGVFPAYSPDMWSTYKTSGWKGLKASKGFAGKMIGGGAVTALGMGLSIYQGYQEGGAWGAFKGGLQGAAEQAAWGIGEMALSRLGIGGVLGPVGWVVAAGYGTYKALEYGQQKTRNLRKLEMVSPVVDPYGLGATMRQRSQMALSRSFINGRMAMGNEAAYIHMTY